MNRRDFVKSSAILSVGIVAPPFVMADQSVSQGAAVAEVDGVCASGDVPGGIVIHTSSTGLERMRIHADGSTSFNHAPL